MKHSIYNVIKKIPGKGYLVYNLLHQNLIYIKKKDYLDFCNLNSSNSFYETWINEKLIVEENFDEYDNKLSRINRKNEMQFVTIFTTTACNARCSYCFESGIAIYSMKDNEIDKIGEKIISSLSSRRLHVTWFGGEPLLKPNVIDKLSKQLIEYCNSKSIIYTSTIITNGSLLSDEIIEKMINKWNVSNVQISLDGTEKKYNIIKNYKDDSNFLRVIANIKKLKLKNRVIVRVNFDDNNIKDCLRLIKYLYKNDLKNDKVYLYFHPIYGDEDKNFKTLNKQFKTIFNTLYKYGYINDLKYFNMHFSINHCEAEKENSYCVFPNGKVSKCQRERPENASISIFDKDFLDNLNSKWKLEHGIPDDDYHCKKCISYPLCKGGCKMYNLNTLTKMHCDRCYIYHRCYDAVLSCLVNVYKDKFN